jgi:hypothetical protein
LLFDEVSKNKLSSHLLTLMETVETYEGILLEALKSSKDTVSALH